MTTGLARIFIVKFVLLALSLLSTAPLHAANTDRLYQDNCAQCHNPKRLGGMGPALLPGNLKRLRKPAASEVIRNGRVATQMPAFDGKLTPVQIEALVEYIYTPTSEALAWGLPEIDASHIIHNRDADLPAQPAFEVADLLNLFLVVELGDHHVTLLDGDRFEPIHRF